MESTTAAATCSADQRTCAICLESLLQKSSRSSSSSTAKVGAAVPCGHVFHFKCYKKWYSAQRRRHQRLPPPQQQQDNGDAFRTKCPMCNRLCENFVQIYLGENSNTTSTMRSPNSAGSGSAEGVASLPSAAAAAAEDNDESSMLLLVGRAEDSAKRLDRVKDKLNKYKKEHKSLEKKLEDERRYNSENLERTIERHAKERRAWKRQETRLQEEVAEKEEEKQAVQRALDRRKEEHRKDRRHWRRECKKMELKRAQDVDAAVEQNLAQIEDWEDQKIEHQEEMEKKAQENDQLLHEIDRTITLQVEERRRWEQRFRAMQDDLEKAKSDKVAAEAKVARATQGIAQMQIYNDMRKGQIQKLTKEKVALVQEVEDLKSTLDEEIVIEFE